MDKIDTQNAEFRTLDALIKAYRALNGMAAVDNDYPAARHTYEGALKNFMEACILNGRRPREK